MGWIESMATSGGDSGPSNRITLLRDPKGDGKVETRSVFLDHDPDAAAVERQLASAVAIAQRHGVAIAIGHPRPATIAVLARRLPQILRDGVRIVPASTLAVRTG